MNGFSKIIGLMGLCLIGTTQLGNGCTSDGGGYDDDYRDRPQPDYGGRPDFGDRDIPRDARVVAEGRDDVLQYRAPSSGRIWLTDADRRILIDERAIQRGEEYIISTKNGKIWINKDRVRDLDFNRSNIHRIYFRSRDNEGGNSGGGGNWRPPSEMRDAERVAYGRGDLSYEAPRDGRVWVVDRTRGDIVYRGDVRRGDRVSVSPRENYISLSTERRRESFSLNPNHDYEIYYQRSAGRDDDRNNSSKDDTSGGRFSGAGATVPKSASMIREARNQDLSFEADAAGTVYLWDAESKSTVQTYRVKNGQRFTVSPKTGETAIDGKTVGKNSLKTNRTYRLYFDRSV